LDTGSDLNILNKDIVPVQFWHKKKISAVGLGNIPTEISYDIPEAILYFRHHCLSLKILLANIPVACISETPFFAAVEPHGSTKLPNGRSGYFISIPSKFEKSKISVKMPFISFPRMSPMVYTIENKPLTIEELKDKRFGIRIKEQLSQNHIQQRILLLK
jgi:hypothetical protein